MKKQLKHIVVNINDLKPAAYNPREELRPGDPEYENIKWLNVLINCGKII